MEIVVAGLLVVGFGLYKAFSPSGPTGKEATGICTAPQCTPSRLMITGTEALHGTDTREGRADRWITTGHIASEDQRAAAHREYQSRIDAQQDAAASRERALADRAGSTWSWADYEAEQKAAQEAQENAKRDQIEVRLAARRGCVLPQEDCNDLSKFVSGLELRLERAEAALEKIATLPPEQDNDTLQAIRHIGKMVAIANAALNREGAK